MTGLGITAFGSYIPRMRLSRQAMAEALGWYDPGLHGAAKGHKALCDWDEDSITMAVEAARDALPVERRNQLTDLFFASTTAPFQDRQNSALILSALDLPEQIMSMDVAASQRAATSALATASRFPVDRNVLILAADQKRNPPAAPQEMRTGDAAAAIVLGSENILAEIVAVESLTRDFVDHFRSTGAQADYEWEERWIREEGYQKILPQVIDRICAQAGLSGDQIDHLILPLSAARVRQTIAKRTHIDPAAVIDPLDRQIGHACTAHALVMLCATLEQAAPGATILMCGFGQGADAIILRTTDKVSEFRPARPLAARLQNGYEETNYTRALSLGGALSLHGGMRSEADMKTALSGLYRNRGMITAFHGGTCQVCGTVQYPLAEYCVNPNCRAHNSLEPTPLSEVRGQIASFTTDWLAYTPSPPSHYGTVSFDNGAKTAMDLKAMPGEQLKVGDPLRMVFRIKDFDHQRNFRRYFWKAELDLSASQGNS